MEYIFFAFKSYVQGCSQSDFAWLHYTSVNVNRCPLITIVALHHHFWRETWTIKVTKWPPNSIPFRACVTLVRIRCNCFLVNPTSFQSCDRLGKSLWTRSSRQSNVSFFLQRDLVIFAESENHMLCIERFSNDCRKTKTKAITPTNHNRSRQRDEPITIPSNYL